MKVTSNFAIVDIKKGRKKLYDSLPENPRLGEPVTGIPVVITGYIVGTWGRDDGVSREFEIQVDSVKLGKVAEIKP